MLAIIMFDTAKIQKLFQTNRLSFVKKSIQLSFRASARSPTASISIYSLTLVFSVHVLGVAGIHHGNSVAFNCVGVKVSYLRVLLPYCCQSHGASLFNAHGLSILKLHLLDMQVYQLLSHLRMAAVLSSAGFIPLSTSWSTSMATQHIAYSSKASTTLCLNFFTYNNSYSIFENLAQFRSRVRLQNQRFSYFYIALISTFYGINYIIQIYCRFFTMIVHGIMLNF